MALVEGKSVSMRYPRRVGLRTEEHTVVDNVTLAIEAGETWGWWASRIGEDDAGADGPGADRAERGDGVAWTARMWREGDPRRCGGCDGRCSRCFRIPCMRR